MAAARLRLGGMGASLALLAACGAGGDASPTASPSAPVGEPFAVRVVSFEPGPGAGFGQDLLPDVVLGPPEGGGERAGTTDVVSLGHGGSIVLELGVDAVDGEGPDLLIFENAFRYGDAPESVWAEPGEVAVSEDGVSWHTFPCFADGYPWEGCAGTHPTLSTPENGIDPTDAEAAGGDAYDLADLGVSSARFVRVTDRGEDEAAPSAGFDLDAVAVVAR